MIKKITYGQTKNVILVEFGTGDIEMVPSRMAKDESIDLAFKTLKIPKKVGETWKTKYSTFDEMKPELVFKFLNVESIQAVIEMLLEVEIELKKSKKGT